MQTRLLLGQINAAALPLSKTFLRHDSSKHASMCQDSHLGKWVYLKKTASPHPLPCLLLENQRAWLWDAGSCHEILSFQSPPGFLLTTPPSCLSLVLRPEVCMSAWGVDDTINSLPTSLPQCPLGAPHLNSFMNIPQACPGLLLHPWVTVLQEAWHIKMDLRGKTHSLGKWGQTPYSPFSATKS